MIKVIKHRINVNQFLTKEALEEMIKRGAAYIKIMTGLSKHQKEKRTLQVRQGDEDVVSHSKYTILAFWPI
jgi:ribosomal protein L19E